MSLMREAQTLAKSGFGGRARDWKAKLSVYAYKSVWNTLQALAARGEVRRHGTGPETIYTGTRSQIHP